MTDPTGSRPNLRVIAAGENPYAPPQDMAAGVPDAPRQYGWEAVGKTVWVGYSSQFPMVDPYTGNNRETMMLHQVTLRYRPWWLLAFPLLGAALGFAFNVTGSLPGLGIALLLGAILGWFLAGIIGMAMPVCSLRLFFEKRTVRIRKTIDRVMAGLFLVFFLGAFLSSAGPRWLQIIPQVAFVCWLAGSLIIIGLRRRLRCVRKDGNRFGIRGFHPRALEALAGET